MKYYTDGKEEIKCFPGQEPEGWNKGRLVYNNGIETRRFYPGQEPEGWIRGKIKKEYK